VPPVPLAAGFVAVHALITLSLLLRPPPAVWAAEHLVLLVAAVLFWTPIIGRRTRLPGELLLLYVLVTSPLLDMAGIVVVGLGHAADGLAMITGMLPLNVVAVVAVWLWMREEERRMSGRDTAAEVAAYNVWLRSLSSPDEGRHQGWS
jgi:cytochrome c oxidase assembly factor CtaG